MSTAAILGKPVDAGQAAGYLRSLSGREHGVISGLCVLDAENGSVRETSMESAVQVRALSRDELRAYLETGEWAGAAGGYRVQGKGARLIERIRGSYSNVVGLPLEALYGILEQTDTREQPEPTKGDSVAVVTMKNLLESGVHFGHQTKRWDPRMRRYIFAERNGIHIIDLQKTIAAIKSSYDVVRQVVLEGKSVLFVGTKKQAQQSIEREAKRCQMFYVNSRWLGGMLTNFSTIKQSLLKLKKIEKMEVDGTFRNLTKKEISLMVKERSRLERNLGGIKEMKELPGVVFIIDTRNESIAVEEARAVGVPIVAVVDTNSNPEGIDYPIPGNDDAIRAINLFTQIIANAVVEAENEVGLEVIENLQDDEMSEEYAGYPEQAVDGSAGDEVETVALGETLQADDADAPERFTDQDYSDFDPSTYERDEKVAEQPTVEETAGIDEDRLYEER